MKNCFSPKKKKAQQLIEFALVVPILMIFIFIVVEFGAAMNSRTTIAEAVKMSMTEVNKLTSLDGDTATKEAAVEDFIWGKIVQYLINHNIPNTASVSVKVNYDSTRNTAIAFVSYEYVPYFLVAGLAGSNISTMTFSSSQTINPNIFKPNNFPGGGFTAQELSQYHTDGGGNPIPSGALADTTAFDYDDGVFNIREHIAFLIRLYDRMTDYTYLEYGEAHARLVDWVGNDLLPPNLRIDLRTGTLEVRSPYYQAGQWFDTKIPYVWVVSALGFTHLYYVKFNSYDMYIPEDASLMYKLRFNSPEVFYNKNIAFCGTGGISGACDNDQRDTATVNERALRMNPLLGEAAPDNSYVIGALEPMVITPATHDFRHVKGFYASYTPDYNNYNAANWSQQYFISISSPQVFGLQEGTTDLPDEVYHADFTDITLNPFFEPYKYRFRLHDHEQGANAGVYDDSIPNPPVGDDDVDDDDDDDDADPETYLQVDIVDVYMDSDGDGIPDAWDSHPNYFDANVNGFLDGNEVSDFWAQTTCNNGDTTGICVSFPDTIVGPFTLPEKVEELNASGTRKYFISTPYKIDGDVEGARTARYLPLFKPAEFVRYTSPGGNVAIYYDKDGPAVTGPNYTRKMPSWWDLPNANARRAIKSGFIHGTHTGNDINLRPSPDYSANVLDANTYTIRTPPGW